MAAAEGFGPLVDEAERCLEREEGEAALAKANAALAVARELNNASFIADAVRKVVHVYNYLGRHEDSHGLASEELAKFKKAGDKRGEATMLLALAETEAPDRGRGKCEEALSLASEAQELFSALGGAAAKGLEGEALLVQLNVHIRRGDSRAGNPSQSFLAALDAGKEALELFQGAGNMKGQAMAMHGVAAARINTKAFEGGIRTAKEALRLWQTLDNVRSQVFELQSIATWCVRAGKPQQGYPFAQEAYDLAREEQIGSSWEASALHLVVQVLCAAGLYDRAQQTASDGASQFQRVQARGAEAVALKAQLSVQLARGDSWQALQAAKQAFAAFADLGDRREQGAILRIQSSLNLKLHRLDEAMVTAKQALKLHQDAEDCVFDRVYGMRTAVDAQVANDQVRDAIQVIEDERDHYSNNDSKREEGIMLLNMVSVHLENMAHEDAMWAAEDAQTLFEEAEDKTGEAAAVQMMAVIHMSAKDYDEAEEVLKRAVPMLQQLADRKGEVGCLLLMAQAIELKLAASGLDLSSTKFRQQAFRAVKVATEAAGVAGKVAEQSLVGAAQCVLSRVLHMAAKGNDAAQAAKAAVSAFREAGDRAGEAHALILSASAMAATGQEEDAKDAASKALLTFRQLGDKQGEQLAEKAIDSIDNLAQQEQEDQEEARQEQMRQGATKPMKQLVSGWSSETAVSVSDLGMKVKRTVVDIVGVDDLEADTPLMTAGLTSQSAVLLRNALTKEIGGASLPFTMMFDFPSVAALTDFFVQRM